MQLDLQIACQRHRDGRTSYTPVRPFADFSKLAVAQIANETEAKPFVEQHHYAGSFPAAIASFGLFESRGYHQRAELVGVATFSVPMNVASDAKAALMPGERACELGRFVLLDHIGTNGETFLLGHARRSLDKAKTFVCPSSKAPRPLYPIILAFSDPVPRATATGAITFRGHIGKIYQAGPHGGINTGLGLYLGRGTAKTMWLTQDAIAIVDRTLNKLRNAESGARHVYELLIRHGAPQIKAGESDKAYVSRALSSGAFRKVYHRGNHRYVFSAGSHKRRKEVQTALNRNLPYPRWTDPA